MSCLRIKPLSVISFANIVSHSGGCLFILWIPLLVSLQKLVSLIRSLLFLLLFLLRKHWYDLCQRMFCLYSLLGVLWCLTCLVFKSLNRSIFVYGVKVCFNFTTALSNSFISCMFEVSGYSIEYHVICIQWQLYLFPSDFEYLLFFFSDCCESQIYWSKNSSLSPH